MPENSTESAKKKKSAKSSDRDESRRPSRHVDEYSAVMSDERPSRRTFAAYAAKPFDTAFDVQASSEVIVLLLRQHPVTQVKWLMIAMALLLLPGLFSSIDLLGFLPLRFQFAALVGWYLVTAGFILQSFIKWFYNVYIITDERIIDIDFHSLIFRDVSAAKIDKIEDTTASTGGFWGSIFDYGTITIQTAAEKREFEFEDVPHPARVSKLINEMIIEEEREEIEGRVS